MTERLAKLAPRAELPKYEYPANVISAATLGKFLKGGITFRIRKGEMEWHGTLDAQRQHGKAIFGGGYLVSDRVAEEEERARTVVFPLSEREREIVERLNRKSLGG